MINKLLVIGSCSVYRRGLVEIFLDGIPEASIFESSSMGQALRIMSRESGVDLVMLDVTKFGGDCCFLVSRIKSLYGGVKVVAFIDSAKNEFVEVLLGAGVDWLIYRFSDPAEIVDDVLFCYGGGESDYGNKGSMPGDELESMLTKRQYSIALLLKEGLTNKEIAKKLSLSEGTVKNYISVIYELLFVSNRANAVNKLHDYL